MQAEYVARDLDDDADLRPQDDDRILQDRLYPLHSLRQEQEAAFREAELVASQLESQKQQEIIAKESAELAKQAKAAEIQAKKAAKRTELGPEPSETTPNTTQIAFRLPDGAKINRRFGKSDKVECLYTYIDTLEVGLPVEYEIAASFPSHPLTNRERTLEEEGLVPRALLHVRET